MFHVKCAQCGTVMELPDEAAEQRVKCPRCSKVQVAPSLEELRRVHAEASRGTADADEFAEVTGERARSRHKPRPRATVEAGARARARRGNSSMVLMGVAAVVMLLVGLAGGIAIYALTMDEEPAQPRQTEGEPRRHGTGPQVDTGGTIAETLRGAPPGSYTPGTSPPTSSTPTSPTTPVDVAPTPAPATPAVADPTANPTADPSQPSQKDTAGLVDSIMNPGHAGGEGSATPPDATPGEPAASDAMDTSASPAEGEMGWREDGTYGVVGGAAGGYPEAKTTAEDTPPNE